MRLWVHVIWLRKNPTTPLALCGPKEDRKLEYLIQQHGEQQTAYAWFLYVNAKPAPYNLKSVKHVDKFTTEQGNIVARTVKDTSAITRFPLSAFLAVADGFLVQSCLHIDALIKGREKAKAEKGLSGLEWAGEILGIGRYEFEHDIFPGMQAAFDAMKATTASVKTSWGVTQKDLGDDEF